MTTKVSVITNPGNRISINNQLGNKLSLLSDIDITTRANNDVLVYVESLDKFVSKVIPIISGGDF